jgi:MoaA/NifB/PqqE/SkfB family radical SAM enzyme
LERLPLLTVYLTERCNSRCIGCDHWRNGRHDLQAATVATWLPALQRLRTSAVVLSGGEPLLNPQWRDIAQLLQGAGMRLWLLTAGLALAKHAAALPGLMEHVTVSLDGADASTYLRTRGVDAFVAVCRGVRVCAELGLDVQLRVTVQRANHRQLPELVRLAKALGARRISFLPADVSNTTAFARRDAPDSGQALDSSDLPDFARELERLQRECADEFASGYIAESPARMQRLHQYFSALLGQAAFPPVRCNAPEFSAVLDARGAVHPCFFIPGAVAPLTDMPGTLTMQQTLNLPAMRSLRGTIARGERPECIRCVCHKWRDPATNGELP